MATVYRGNRSFYEEDGRLYSDETKRIEYNMETMETITESSVSATVKEEPKQETVTESSLTCSVCGFEAKSNAGLAVHRMKHK